MWSYFLYIAYCMEQGLHYLLVWLLAGFVYSVLYKSALSIVHISYLLFCVLLTAHFIHFIVGIQKIKLNKLNYYLKFIVLSNVQYEFVFVKILGFFFQQLTKAKILIKYFRMCQDGIQDVFTGKRRRRKKGSWLAQRLAAHIFQLIFNNPCYNIQLHLNTFALHAHNISEFRMNY